MIAAFLLAPEYRDYVWGGSRLRPDVVPTAEAWVVYENDRIVTGPLSGQTLAEAAAAHGAALLGTRAMKKTGLRFPLLIKLLDCAAWLSLQVHPNDEQAKRMEGPDQFGKTEAWHFIEVNSGSEILCGPKPGTTAAQLQQAIRGGKLLDCMQHIPIRTGSSILIPAGMIHALGPGLFVYEVQQTSDLTYRVWDWDRPNTQARPLHIEKSVVVADPTLTGRPVPPAEFVDGGRQVRVASDYFVLEMLTARERPVELHPRGETFHALTVIQGSVNVEGDGWSLPLTRMETGLVPASAGAYQVRPLAESKILKSSIGE